MTHPGGITRAVYATFLTEFVLVEAEVPAEPLFVSPVKHTFDRLLQRSGFLARISARSTEPTSDTSFRIPGIASDA